MKTKRQPDITNLYKVLRKERPDRPTLYEFLLSGTLYSMLGDGEFAPKDDGLDQFRRRIATFKNAGYDFVMMNDMQFGFPQQNRERKGTISLNEGSSIWDRESYEQYKWKEVRDCDFSLFEKLAPDLPEGMKFIVYGPSGTLENAINIVGYDNLCVMLYDDPELAKQIFDDVGSRLLEMYTKALEYDTVAMLMANDDWGFNTQTMLSTADMRKYVFPWHKKIVAAAHRKGKPAMLHSCGNAELIMEDVIEDMRFDGKHSYEDNIMPVEEAYDRYKGRIAVLGGMDVDFMARKSPEEIYRRSKAMMERAEEAGGYALGTGNSVPEYITPEKFFAMTKAVLE